MTLYIWLFQLSYFFLPLEPKHLTAKGHNEIVPKNLQYMSMRKNSINLTSIHINERQRTMDLKWFTLSLISCIWALRISESSCHFESSWSDLLAQAFFKASLHSVIFLRISLFSSTHSGAQPFLDRILYKVSSAGSTCGFGLRLRGRPFPGRFSKCPSSMECHILCSTTLTISVSDLPRGP